MSEQIKKEDGVRAAVRSFHSHSPRSQMQCDVLPDQPACWRVKAGRKRTNISSRAAAVLMQDTGLAERKLKSYQSKPMSVEKRRLDPVTAIFSSLISTSVRITDGAVGVVAEPGRALLREGRRTSSQVQISKDNMHTGKGGGGKGCDKQRSKSSSGQAKDESSTKRESSEADFERAETNHKPDYAKAAKTSGRSVGKTMSSALRGVLVELPLTTAEGFRYMPRMWGDEVKHHGDIKDWQSGTVVAGKSVVYGVLGGAYDVVKNSASGAQEEGVLGAAKGLGTGLGSLASGTLAAGVGVVAYPGRGIAKSLHGLVHGSTAKSVTKARLAEGKWNAEKLAVEDRRAIVEGYYRICNGR